MQTAGRRAKRTETWDKGVSCSMYIGYLSPLLVFKVILGSFGVLVSKIAINTYADGLGAKLSQT